MGIGNRFIEPCLSLIRCSIGSSNWIRQHLDVVADMLEDYNGKTQEEVIQLEEERRKQKKAPPGLYFDKQAFLKIAKRTNLWTEDYIDSLFIFYRYHELSRQFRAIYPKPEANKSGGKHK